MTDIYIAIVLVSILFILVAHVWPNQSAFYLGSGHYGAIVSGLSIVAAFTGGGALVNTTSLASKYGTWALFDVFPAVIGLAISAALVAIGFFGKRFSTDFFDINSNLYDSRAVTIHYAQVAFLYLLVMSAQFRAVATIASQLNIQPQLAVIFCAALVGVYAFKGFTAVTRTDILQIFLMFPLYIVLAAIAFEPSRSLQDLPVSAQIDMPIDLIIALSLPVFFIPISQEIHQRGAAVDSSRKIALSYLLAASVYTVLGLLLVLTFAGNQNLSFSSVIAGGNRFIAIVVAVGLFSAILSTLDTSTNIASHSFQKLKPFDRFNPALVQSGLLLIAVLLYLYFKTVLSIILFALFLYMAGPALTFIGVFVGIHPRLCATVGGVFASLQMFVHFKASDLLSSTDISKFLPINNPIKLGIILLLLQTTVLAFLGLHRKYR